MEEEAQRLETRVGNSQEQIMQRTLKRLRDTVDPEELERERKYFVGWAERPKIKEYVVGGGKVAEEVVQGDGGGVAEEVTEEDDFEVATEDPYATEEGALSESD